MFSYAYLKENFSTYFIFTSNELRERNNSNSFHQQTKLTLNKKKFLAHFTGVDLEYKSSSVFALDLKSGRLLRRTKWSIRRSINHYFRQKGLT